MDLETMLRNIEENRKGDLESIKSTTYEVEEDGGQAPEAEEVELDLYQRRVNSRREGAKKRYPSGSSWMVLRIVQDAVNGDGGRPGLARAYRRARDDSDSLKEQGWGQRAKDITQQYMEEEFLPIVEVVVNYTSPDELLNNAKALKILDSYVLGAGSGTGFTESYVRSAYGNQLGARPGLSDPEVATAVRRIKVMARNDNIRGAYGLAKKMRKKIDQGSNMASEEDYEFLLRVGSVQ